MKQFCFLYFLWASLIWATSIRQVAYISTTASSEGLHQLEIEEILLKCRRYNRLLDITGILVYHQVSLFQIVEGTPNAVDQVMTRIHQDPRHRGMIILHDRIVTERLFGGWSMQFRDLTYSKQMEEMAKQTEKSLFQDITEIGGLDTPASSELASRKVGKLLDIYKRLIFR